VSRELHGERAVVFSLFVARLLMRVMGAYFLKPHHTVNKSGHSGPEGRLAQLHRHRLRRL
jgi:multidrug efflux pump subunit AcrB